MEDYIVLDTETQYPAGEGPLALAVAVTWDEEFGYRIWMEAQAPDLIAALQSYRRIVGYNLAFDFRVLAAYGNLAALKPKVFDLFLIVQRALGRSVSLAVLAEDALGEPEETDGLEAAQAYRAGDFDALVEHCQRDVELIKMLYDELVLHGSFYFQGEEILPARARSER